MALPSLDDLQDAAAKAALELLDRFRKEIIGAILSTRDPLSAYLKGLLTEIAQIMDRYQREMTGLMQTQLQTAAENGDQAVLDALTGGGIEVPLSYLGVNPQLVRTAAEYTADLVKGLTAQALSDITRDVRLASLGGLSTTDLIDRIGTSLDSPSTFRSIADRAEAIARTEVARVRNTAWSEQAAELDGRFPGMKKRWVHSTQAPGATGHQRRMARPNHVRLARETATTPIPVTQAFDLGNGITAMYPHDPSLPAGEVVNCRCVAVLVPPEPGG